MTGPARKDCFHPLQVVDIKFSGFVVVLDALDNFQSVLFDEIYSVWDRVSRQVTITFDAAGVIVEHVKPKPRSCSS